MQIKLTPSICAHYTNAQEYRDFLDRTIELNDKDKKLLYRQLARTDLFFLLYFVLNRKFIEHPFLFARCKEVEKEPNGYLDLWARGSCKSTIITFGKTIQDILASHGENPLPEWKEITGGSEPSFMIFSATLDLAKEHLYKIKRECESNQFLKDLFPDVLWDNPSKHADRWNLSTLTFRQKNSSYPTLEAFGLNLDLPVGKRCNVMILDDCVRESNVSTPEQILKSKTSWDGAQNYFMKALPAIRRHIGTFYHWNDLHCQLINAGSVKARKYPATDNGQLDGKLVYMKSEEWQQIIRDLNRYNIACQYLMNPTADSVRGFKFEWLKYAQYNFATERAGNLYIVVDPAGSKEKNSDYTVMIVIAVCEDENYYIVDMIRDRLSLSEKAQMLFNLVRKYKPLHVGYEQYGMQADIQHIQEKMAQYNYRFNIVALDEKLGGKDKRIMRLEPLYRNSRIYMPPRIEYIDVEGKPRDLVQTFIKEEYMQYPACTHDDMLDALSRILDSKMGVVFPMADERMQTMSYSSFERRTNEITGY
jgi:predicted phage terminase large subunit-like protein